MLEKENSNDVFYQNKEMISFYNPFKIIYAGHTISHVLFKEIDSVWAKNFKRAFASAIQIQGEKIGAFVEKEVSLQNRRKNENFNAFHVCFFFNSNSQESTEIAQQNIMWPQSPMVIYLFEKHRN